MIRHSLLSTGSSSPFSEARLIGKYWRMEASNFPNFFFRHRNSRVRIDRFTAGSLYDLDSSWNIVRGLCGKGISFRSKNFPQHYIRHKGWFAYINKFDGSALFKKDACFIPRAGLIDPKFVSFESVNFPNHFLRHQNYWVRISRNDNSALFKKDATWKPRIIKGIFICIVVIHLNERDFPLFYG